MSYVDAVALKSAPERVEARGCLFGHDPPVVDPPDPPTRLSVGGHLEALWLAYPALTSMLTRKLGDRSLAEDLLQEATLESLSQLASDRIAEPERIAGYVYRVALNLLRNYRRKSDNRQELRADPAALDSLTSEDSPPIEHARALIAEHVRQVLAMLPMRRDREILQRFYLDEETKPDICRTLGLSETHFDKVVHRARQRMRVLMIARGLDGERVRF